MQRVMGVGLNVVDLARSVAFYEQVLGMREVARYTTPAFVEAVMSYGDDERAPCVLLLENHDRREPYILGDALAKVVLVVDDLRAVFARVVQWGGAVEREPVEYPQHHKWVAIASDPDGYRLELLQEL